MSVSSLLGCKIELTLISCTIRFAIEQRFDVGVRRQDVEFANRGLR
jgi:hypothetical protein